MKPIIDRNLRKEMNKSMDSDKILTAQHSTAQRVIDFKNRIEAGKAVGTW